MTMTQRIHSMLSSTKLSAAANAALAVLLLFFGAGLASAVADDVQKQTLLTTTGTLYQALAGKVADLGITDPALNPGLYVVAWSSVAQDGTSQQGVLQSSLSANPKTNLDLTFDEPTGSFVILWREDATIMNQIQLAVLRAGQWSLVGLLPNIGFPHALNPKMLLSHETVTTLDDQGNPTQTSRSTLSVAWWEEAKYAQARYAPIFLNESIDSDSLTIYDLPVLVGGGGATSYTGVAPASYLYPSLQLEGPGGAVLATFADLHAQTTYVVRIDFPTSLGDPNDPTNRTFERRRIPVVGVLASGPLAFQKPGAAPENTPVGTIVGSSYNPTFYWQDTSAMRYIRFNGTAWSDTLSIPIDSNLTFDKALRLLEGMAARN
jgi:hypothetical protein